MDGMTVSTRLAETRDIRTAAELRWKWLTEDSVPTAMPLEEFAAQFEQWASASSHLCVLLEEDGRAIGMAWLAHSPRVPSPNAFERATGDIQSVYVVPEARNRGLSRLLLGHVIAIGKERGYERLTVHSKSRSIPVYERLGFASSGRLMQIVLQD